MEEEESKIMGLKQDFVLRRLEDQGRFLARLILGKDEAHYELPEYEAMDNRADALYRKLLALVDDGEINEAENILLDELDTGDLNMFEMALSGGAPIHEGGNRRRHGSSGGRLWGERI